MRSRILQMFRQNAGQFLSGEEISRRLEISRTAVWKHIQSLKEAGFAFEGHSRRGYRLCQLPDRLLPELVTEALTTAVLGREIRYFREVDSTHSAARSLALAGCPDGTLVLAETQTAGQGRLARGWFSPQAGGIWMSLVLRPSFLQPHEAPKCTLLAAVAITRAIRRAAGVQCGIKWPNDILLDGRKLVGILTEMSADMDTIRYIVLSVGINVNIPPDDFPPELSSIATSLAAAAGTGVDRLQVLSAVLGELEAACEEVRRAGFAGILDAWREYSVTLGQQVDVIEPGSRFTGTAVDIDHDGALLVETAGGVVKVWAGDVSIRPHGAMNDKNGGARG